MGVATALLTVEQYMELPEEETMGTELVEGEVVCAGDFGYPYAQSRANAAKLLHRYIFDNPIGKVFAEPMFTLGENEGRIPDVSLVLNRRLPPADRFKPLEGAPELAFEVVSSETAAFMERKINLYLATGCRAVWIAYPLERTIWIHRTGGSVHLREGQFVEEPDLLPGLRVPVERFFDGI
jgi:Uma2 family endonuclease